MLIFSSWDFILGFRFPNYEFILDFIIFLCKSSSFIEKDIYLVSLKVFLYPLIFGSATWLNFFIIFITNEIFKTFFTKRKLVRLYYFINICIIYKNWGFEISYFTDYIFWLKFVGIFFIETDRITSIISLHEITELSIIFSEYLQCLDVYPLGYQIYIFFVNLMFS